MMSTGDEPVASSTNLGLVKQQSDCKSNHDRRSAQNGSSRHHSSLTPLEEVEGMQDTNLSPIKRIRSESSLAGEDPNGSHLEDWK